MLKSRDPRIHLFLSSPALNRLTMDTVSLISALIGAQTGALQLAVAARLARMGDPTNGSSIAQLVGAADQSANSLANVAENIGTNLDVSA
jgi:hypothetical protein